MRIGINGFGRIGRLVFRVIEQKRLNNEDIKVVAINDLNLSNKEFVYLLENDSVHGNYKVNCIFDNDDCIFINENKIIKYNEKNPANINWSLADVDCVIDCTGFFTTIEKAQLHLHSESVKKVVVSAPSKDIPMFVMGVNHHDSPKHKIISNASCTTNCLSPLVNVIHSHAGVKDALMTTIHASTSTQSVVDRRSNKNVRLGRSALNNIIPTSTGAAKCVTKIIPELEGKLTGMAFRVPTTDVSVVDLTIHLEKPTSYDEIIKCLKNAEKNELQGILSVCDKELVSSDFIGNSHSCIVDVKAGIELNPTFFKIVAWYDNEWGYSNRLVELVQYANKN